MQNKKLTFIGGGNLSQAMVFGLLNTGFNPENLYVCDRNLPKCEKFIAKGVQASEVKNEAIQQADVIILAIKPQGFKELCRQLKNLNVDLSGKWVISVLAAVDMACLRRELPVVKSLVRAMPNTPVFVGKGMTALWGGESLTTEVRTFSENLFKALGKTLWLSQEEDMHLFIAGAGSSPAYFFQMMEAMEAMLVSQGMAENQARAIIAEAALGAAQMAVSNDLPFSQLRSNVTSKGGITAAALQAMDDNHFNETINQAMKACVYRSKEMDEVFSH